MPVTPQAVEARDLRTYRHFDLLLSIFMVVLLISNLVGQKLCALGPFVISGGSFCSRSPTSSATSSRRSTATPLRDALSGWASSPMRCSPSWD